MLFNTPCMSIAVFVLSLALVQLNAFAQDKVKAKDQQSEQKVRDHRTDKTVRDHRIDPIVRDHRNKVVYLDNAECTTLGGEVKEGRVSICNSGKFCRREGADGEIYRVCITKATAATENAPQAPTPNRFDRFKVSAPLTPNEVVKATPLTSQECEGLGGVVGGATECVLKACSTTDKHGVIRVACIDKVAE